MKQRVLITGGAGFIGSNLIRHMLSLGYQVLSLDKLTYAGNLNSLADLPNCSDYHFAQVDICDLEYVQRSLTDFAPHSIMHLAAESHVDRSIDGPLGDNTVVAAASVTKSFPSNVVVAGVPSAIVKRIDG
jgi:dTDP-glucose 4,6-dehydratase